MYIVMSFHISQIIYCVKGSNRSWEWLAMVLVSIFALCDVVQQVQSEYKTPFNASSHMCLSAEADLNTLQNYLKVQQLQTYKFD